MISRMLSIRGNLLFGDNVLLQLELELQSIKWVHRNVERQLCIPNLGLHFPSPPSPISEKSSDNKLTPLRSGPKPPDRICTKKDRGRHPVDGVLGIRSGSPGNVGGDASTLSACPCRSCRSWVCLCLHHLVLAELEGAVGYTEVRAMPRGILSDRNHTVVLVGGIRCIIEMGSLRD